ncbi:MAG: LiaI-LiaF-like domain-containing protein [Burkholderiales bacterium]
MNKSGWILIVVGGALLAHNFGWFTWGWLKQWWPVALIALGVWSIVMHKPGDKNSSNDSNDKS